MYRIDIFSQVDGKKKSKKIGSAWYNTLEEAENAKKALRQPRRKFTYVPRENCKQVSRYLFGFQTSNPIEDNKY